MSGLEFVIIGFAALAGGAVNALAGGGTLITFPALTALGIPAVAANVTNTVALCPGYLGGTFAQINDLPSKKGRLAVLAAVSVVGGILGGLLLLETGEKTFRSLVPFLILLASGLLAVQGVVRNWILGRIGQDGDQGKEYLLVESLTVGLASIYGGYFGAGLGVIVLAALGLVINDTLTRINAIKQLISLFTNIAAALFFVFSGKVVWTAALVMAVGALVGGSIGGRLAGRVSPVALRWIVVTIGVIISILYLV